MQLNITFLPNSTEVVILILLCILIAAFLLYRRFPMHLIYKSKIGFESMLDAVNEPLAIITADFTVRRVNRAYVNMAGLTYKTAINAKCYKALRGRSSPCADCLLAEALSASGVREIEVAEHPRGKGAVSITFTPHAMPVNARFAEICVIEHIRDITAFAALKNDLERRNKFLDMLTRKLRTAQRGIKAELKVARQIQLGLLPTGVPQSDKIRIDMTYKPATEVGGDVYDFICMDDNRLGIFIGDASGHGLASSLIGTLSKMSLYNHTRDNTPLSTAELLELMNRDLKAHIHTSHYITCFWSIFDFDKSKLTYSRAGHPMQIALRRDGTLHTLSSNGIFLGITDSAVYEEKEFPFEKGDRFFWFTDGICDVFRKGRENSLDKNDFMGYAKFTALLKQTAGIPFDRIIETLREKLAGYKFDDDYTLIVAEIS